MLLWENTDQFGNLKVATSFATGLEDIESDLRDMARAVFEDHGEDVLFSIDVNYAEISAPKGDQVSYLLNIPFVAGLIAGGMDKSEIQDSLTRQMEGMVGETAKVVGPWD